MSVKLLGSKWDVELYLFGVSSGSKPFYRPGRQSFWAVSALIGYVNAMAQAQHLHSFVTGYIILDWYTASRIDASHYRPKTNVRQPKGSRLP